MQPHSPTQQTHKGIVFVVDDDEDLLHSIEEVLEDEGYLVLGARSGEEALSRMRGISGRATAVVDLLMPDMNGWQLMERMKTDEELSQIPVIICTGQEALVDGGHTVLHKPVHAQKLLAAVRDALTR